MDMEHSFTVAAPIGEVWSAFLEPARVAPCFPGATLTGSDEKSFTGTVKVKLGPIAMLYKGTGEFVDTDETTHTATIDAKGKDSRGNGQANAKVTATLTEADAASTNVVVRTDLSITGKPAQMGRGLIVEVGNKIIGQFADCLSQRLGIDAEAAQESAVPESTVPASGGQEPEPEMADLVAAVAPQAEPEHEQKTAAVTELTPRSKPVYPETPDAIDLLDSGGSAVLKRLAPVAVGAVLGGLIVWLAKR